MASNMNGQNVHQMLYEESQISAYDNITSSVKTQDAFGFDHSHTDTSDYPSNYSDEPHHFNTAIKKAHKQKQKQKNNIVHRHPIVPNQHNSKYQGSAQMPNPINKLATRYSNYSNTSADTQTTDNTVNTFSTIQTISEYGKHNTKDTFAKQIILDQKMTNQPWNRPNFNYGGGLTKKLSSKKLIRESIEMDLNASMQSAQSSGPPMARLSEIAKKSVITLRMISHNPSKQIRLKLYLPLHPHNSTGMNSKPQIIVLFVNRGSTMLTTKSFVEDNYPNGVLTHKIKQLCIADDDGDIDEDFPPINSKQDITSLGVQNFWIDRMFDSEQKKKPSIIYSETEMTMPSDVKHKDTMKERLISDNNENGSSEDSESEEMEDRDKCCWCCFGGKGDRKYSCEDEVEDSLEYSDRQKKLIKNRGSQDMEYNPPNSKSDENPFDPDTNTSTKVRYASL